MRHPVARTAVIALMLWLCTGTPAFAYVGPGMGVGVIGTIVGLVMALALAVAGLLWYPLKRLFRRTAAGNGARRRERTGAGPGAGGRG